MEQVPKPPLREGRGVKRRVEQRRLKGLGP
jgi:hypothetical protein